MTPIKTLIQKRLQVKDYVTLYQISTYLAYHGHHLKSRTLRKLLNEMEAKDGLMLVSSSTRAKKGHKIASKLHEAYDYLAYCEKYLKSWAKKVRIVKRNINRQEAKLFPYKRKK